MNFFLHPMCDITLIIDFLKDHYLSSLDNGALKIRLIKNIS